MFNALYFRTFITLVETGSFTQTARRLEMTQPGVSQHVRKLEQYLDKPLLERHGRRFTLTEAGRRAYDYALKLFTDHEQFRHSLDADSLFSGECRLASPGSVGLMLYPFLLGQQQMHPGLTVSYSWRGATISASSPSRCASPTCASSPGTGSPSAWWCRRTSSAAAWPT